MALDTSPRLDGLSVNNSLETDSPNRSQHSAIRNTIAVLLLALVWISVNPFQDLASRSVLETLQSGNFVNQIAFTLAGLAIVLFLVFGDVRGLRALRRSVYIATAFSLSLSVVDSQDVGLSLRRFVLSALVVFIAAILPLITLGRRNLGVLLFAMSVLVVSLCWTGILVIPHLAIHQSNDLFAAHEITYDSLPGSWRGIYPHKNIAGAMMAIFVFIGLYAARSINFVAGYALAFSSALFLSFAQAKTSFVLLPLTLIVSTVGHRTKSPVGTAIVILTPFVIVALATIGSIFSETFSATLAGLSPDTTFTGRTEIWRYVVGQITDRPLLGYGFSAFWHGETALFTDSSSVASFAQNSHNSFLETTLTSGVVGLVPVTIWLVFTPLIDFQRARNYGADPALTHLFLRMWIFGLYFSLLEGMFFDRSNPVWFSMVFATFLLRYMSIYPLKE